MGPLIPQAQKSTARNLLPPLSQAGGGSGVHNPICREYPVDVGCESHISYLDQHRQKQTKLTYFLEQLS